MRFSRFRNETTQLCAFGWVDKGFSRGIWDMFSPENRSTCMGFKNCNKTCVSYRARYVPHSMVGLCFNVKIRSARVRTSNFYLHLSSAVPENIDSTHTDAFILLHKIFKLAVGYTKRESAMYVVHKYRLEQKAFIEELGGEWIIETPPFRYFRWMLVLHDLPYVYLSQWFLSACRKLFAFSSWMNEYLLRSRYSIYHVIVSGRAALLYCYKDC